MSDAVLHPDALNRRGGKDVDIRTMLTTRSKSTSRSDALALLRKARVPEDVLEALSEHVEKSGRSLDELVRVKQTFDCNPDEVLKGEKDADLRSLLLSTFDQKREVVWVQKKRSFCVVDPTRGASEGSIFRTLRTAKDAKMAKAAEKLAANLAIAELGDDADEVMAAATLRMKKVIEDLKKLPMVAKVVTEARSRRALFDDLLRVLEREAVNPDSRFKSILAGFQWDDDTNPMSDGQKMALLRVIAENYMRTVEMCYEAGDETTRGSTWEADCRAISTDAVRGEIKEKGHRKILGNSESLCAPVEGQCLPAAPHDFLTTVDGRPKGWDELNDKRKRIREYLKQRTEEKKKERAAAYGLRS